MPYFTRSFSITAGSGSSPSPGPCGTAMQPFGSGLIASIHCIAAMTGESLVERYDADFAVNPLHDAIMPGKNGCLPVPQGPGLGVEPDMAVVEKLRVR